MEKKQFISYAQKSVSDVEKELKTSLDEGLSEAEVKERLAKHGPNVFPEKKVTWLHLLIKQVYSSFFLLFLALAILSFVFGEHLNAGIILAFLFINAAVGFYQEFQANRTLEALKKYLHTTITVLRDGKEAEILSTELVPGDILILYPGDIVAGDIRIARATSLEIDESVLTGESASVAKTDEQIQVKSRMEAANIGFAGTTVVAGKAFGIVCATGGATVMSDIAKLAQIEEHESSLSKGTRELSSFITKIIIVAILALFLGNLAVKGFQINLADLILFSVAMAITVTPEALPVVITFSLARGVKRLAKNHVLVKRLSVIDDLGAIEILCTDKTGTLTENTLTVGEIRASDAAKTLFYAALTTSYKGKIAQKSKKGYDYILWDALPEADKQLVQEYNGLAELPYDPAHKHNVTVVQHAKEGAELIVRGSAEDIFQFCAPINNMNELNEWLDAQGQKGYRALAVATKKIKFIDEKELEKELNNLELLGLISFTDPIKKGVAESIQFAQQLGIEIKILSGDVKEVCAAISRQVGLIQKEEQVMTGAEFDELSDDQKQKAVQEIVVFARVTPEQKYQIIELLQKNKVVGYLGDGINDVPALKLADVSIAVNNAVDVAYRAANIIILQKSLHVICTGVQEGRKVVTNTLKYIRTALGSIWGNFLSLSVASLVLPYLPMLPVQLLLVNLLADFPMIAISTDAVDKEDLRYPHRYHVRDIILVCIAIGSMATAADLIFFIIFKHFKPEILQSGWFVESVLTAIVFIFCIRTNRFILLGTRPSWPLIVLAMLAGGAAVILPFTKFGRVIFKLVPLSMHHYAIIGAIVVFFLIVTESMKLIVFKFIHKKTRRRVPKHGDGLRTHSSHR